MSIYGYDVPYYGFSDPAITRTLYGMPLIPPIDYEDDDYNRRRPPPPPMRNPAKPSSPPKRRHDGTSPLPLGMDWSLSPRVWDGRNSVWPHGSSTGWSYCVTIPSWTILPSTRGSDSVVFFRVQVGIQSPEGITTTRGVLRRFNDFLKLFSELKEEFPNKNLPPAPPKRLLSMRSRTILEERRCALEDWVEKLLSDIDVSRTALVAIFLELEAAARSSFQESNQNGSDANSVDDIVSPDQSPSSPDTSLFKNSSSAELDLGGSTPYEASDLGTLRLERDTAERKEASELEGTTKTDIEDIFARLNQEIIARQYLTTKVKELEVEIETISQSSRENLQQAVSAERERFTQMQWHMEELQKKCTEMELKLKTEQDAKVHAESMKASIMEQNKMLLEELNDVKKQVESLRKQNDEMELKSKSDVKLLVKEIKSLRSSHSELNQELSKCLKEKSELEKEKQRWDVQNAAQGKLLHECQVLYNRLQESSVNVLVEEEDRLEVDTSLQSDVLGLLATSDNQIGLLLAEAQLVGQTAEATIGTTNQDDNSNSASHTNEELRMLLADIFTDNAKLRKKVNAAIHCSLRKPDKTINDDVK